MAIQLKTKIPGPKSQQLMARRENAVARGPFHVTPIFISRAQGAVLEDVDGNHLIDFAAGIGVTNTGHGQGVVVDAVLEQAQRFLHASFNVTPYENYIELCEALTEKVPGSFAKKSFLANSGAEAVENAIKIARAFTKKPGVISFEHGFHGRTYMAMALTSKATPYKDGFGPFASHVYKAPFPYAYRWPKNADGFISEQNVCDQAFDAFKSIAQQEVGLNQLGAVIIEPVLGEGGFVPAPKAFLKMISEYCSKNGIVFIADEIQSGFGRTGTLLASDQLGIEPDLICMAKGLAGGMPLSAVVGRAEIMDAPQVGGIGGTYAGSPVACAAALGVLKTMEKPEFLKHARHIGKVLTQHLVRFKEKFENIGDVRGLGPMMAMELVRSRETREPYPEAVKALVKRSYENGVVLMSAGTYGNVIRFLMPLTISESELIEGLQVVEAGLAECL